MIQVTDGKQVIVVTNGAYETIYKRMGFQPIERVHEAEEIAQAASKAMEEHGVPYDPVAEGKPADELTELLAGLADKPVAEWTKEECSAFVEAHSIDLGGVKRASAIKAVIQNWINEQDDIA